MPQADVLLVIDAQNGLNRAAGYSALIDRINERLDLYHDEERPVIFMQHTDEELPYGSDAWRLDTRLHRQMTDTVILKYHTDVFYETGLVDRLQHMTIGSIEICGLQTEYCVDTAIRVGHDQGFDMMTISGMSTTFDTPELPAAVIRRHHEGIWDGSFATVYQPFE
ncbi:isochorismatase family protein [Levilactobacillus tujiorum]|uniref:isochorismatase family protein n=1 Tax=Levilactobacillus tujiorum TaxID=2912243 RepID=UPI0014567DB1|nr:isochorismatase family protein [Levilactobacillus tujiorum]NLR31589.1 isochorismatase family protein [Levilactobacillus tujiorum]